MEEQLNRLKVLDRDIQVLTHAIAVLEWDQETYMPELGIEERAEQLALLKGILHQNITSSEIGELLDRLGADTNNPEGNRSLGIRDRAIIREVFRRYKINTNLPASLIKRLARQTSITQSRWVQAKNQSDFGLFAPYLEQLLSLILEKAEKLGYKESLYDPLLDEYEPWMKTSELEAILLPLQDQLIRILEQIIHSNRTIDSSVMGRSLSLKIQRDFNTELLLSMGYDFKKGRLDESAHPFTTTLGRADIRLTTRYKSDRFASSIFSTIHEGGHGLYEMGFDEELQWTVLAEGASLGIHESQSRMWENLIGRSLPFWKYFYPRLKSRTKSVLSDVSLENFYKSINKVEPSLIRVEADEVTYNLHIILRFNLEKRLICHGLKVKDLPEAWNEESKKLLGLCPERDAEGVLQDIHWSMGAFGYFPTYSLGNLYAAQIYSAMKAENSSLDREIERGRLSTVLGWLRDRIHRHGKTYPAGDLCRQVTGERLNADYFIRYLYDKFKLIYGF